MAITVIPLQAVASQMLNVSLDGVPCTFKVYQKGVHLYMDITRNRVPIITGALCRDRSRVIRCAYRGFTGDVYFVDSQGEQDPHYSGLGSRWVLMHEGANNG